MAHRNDDKHAHLLTLTGETAGQVDDLERQWLESVVVAPAGEHINDLWHRYFVEQGATAGDFNGAAYEYLIDQGVPAGALPEMWAYAWANALIGGAVPPPPGFYNVINGVDNVVNGVDNVVATIT